YTYAYATLGEMFAWIIGWDLILEYAVGSATVAHGWSAHFQEFIPLFGLDKYLPFVLSKGPFDYCVSVGKDCPHTVMVGIKLVIVLMVIGIGAFYINPANWHPFAPSGYTGVSFFGHTLRAKTA